MSYINGDQTLPSIKRDIAPLKIGVDPANYVRAADFNALKNATQELLEFARAGGVFFPAFYNSTSPDTLFIGAKGGISSIGISTNGEVGTIKYLPFPKRFAMPEEADHANPGPTFCTEMGNGDLVFLGYPNAKNKGHFQVLSAVDFTWKLSPNFLPSNWVDTDPVPSTQASFNQFNAIRCAPDKVLMLGGYWSSSTNTEPNIDAFIFNTLTNTVTRINAVVTGIMGLTSLIVPGMSMLSDGKVLIAGGYDGTSGVFTDKCWIFDPSLNTFTATSPLPQAMRGRVTTVGVKHYIFGGDDALGESAKVMYYTEYTGLWTQLSDAPSTIYNDCGRILLPDGRVFFTDQPSQTPMYYTPSTNSWISVPSYNTTYGFGIQNNDKVTIFGSKLVICAGGSVNDGTYDWSPIFWRNLTDPDGQFYLDQSFLTFSHGIERSTTVHDPVVFLTWNSRNLVVFQEHNPTKQYLYFASSIPCDVGNQVDPSFEVGQYIRFNKNSGFFFGDFSTLPQVTSSQSIAQVGNNTITGSSAILAIGDSSSISNSNGNIIIGSGGTISFVDGSCVGGGSVINGASASIIMGYGHIISSLQTSVIGGAYNTVTGANGCVVGAGHTVTDSSSMCAGYANNISGNTGTAFGSHNTVTSPFYGIAFGLYALANQHNQIAHGNGDFVGGFAGSVQSFELIAKTKTTAATVSDLLLNDYYGAEYPIISPNSAWTFDIQIVAKELGTTNTASFMFDCNMVRDAGSAVLTSNARWSYNPQGWNVSLSTDIEKLKITVNGLVGSGQIRWVATIRGTQAII